MHVWNAYTTNEHRPTWNGQASRPSLIEHRIIYNLLTTTTTIYDLFTTTTTIYYPINTTTYSTPLLSPGSKIVIARPHSTLDEMMNVSFLLHSFSVTAADLPQR